MSVKQVSVYLTDGTVLTFQEDSGDIFESVRKRLESASGRIRSKCYNTCYNIQILRTYTASQHKEVIHQIIYRLRQQSMPKQQVTEAVNYSQCNILHIVRKIENHGGKLETYRVDLPPGKPGHLSTQQLALLHQTIEQPADKVGFPNPEGATPLFFNVHSVVCNRLPNNSAF